MSRLSREAEEEQMTKRRKRPYSKTEIKKLVREVLRPRYTIECYYRGFDSEMDRGIERLAKTRLKGSGMLLAANLRDLCFDYISEAKAMAAATRIDSAFPKVIIMLRTFQRL